MRYIRRSRRPGESAASTSNSTFIVNDQPTDRWINAGRDAALHILGAGYIPLLDTDVLDALHHRGGRDRALAEMLRAAAGGEIR